MADDYRNILSDTSTPLGELTIHATTNAEFETAGDTDLFAINLTAGQSYYFQTMMPGPSGARFQQEIIDPEGKSYFLGEGSGWPGVGIGAPFTPSQTGTYYFSMHAFSFTGQYSITVDRPPTANDDIYIVTGGQLDVSAAEGMLSNDSDPDGDLLKVGGIWPGNPDGSFTKATPHGSVTWHTDGSFTYTADPDFHGVDVFDYSVSAGTTLAMSQAQVYLVVEDGSTPVTTTITFSDTGDDNILFANESASLTFRNAIDLDISEVGLSTETLGSFENFFAIYNDPGAYTGSFVPAAEDRGAVTVSVDNLGLEAELTFYVNTCIPTSGTSGRDKLSGSKWDDNIVGFGGDDTLSGNAGEDWLFGAGGNDALNGGTGIDWLFGGIGNDSLSGGAGADLFVFNAFGFGRDVITDFRASEGDKVDLRALNIDFDDLTIARSGRHDTLITIGSDAITLLQVDAATLHVGDFLL